MYYYLYIVGFLNIMNLMVGMFLINNIWYEEKV